jgi:hypothetical protein
VIVDAGLAVEMLAEFVAFEFHGGATHLLDGVIYTIGADNESNLAAGFGTDTGLDAVDDAGAGFGGDGVGPLGGVAGDPVPGGGAEFGD